MSDANAEIIIVGGGLSGLATAYLLARNDRSVRVLEARAAAGGRIRSVVDPGSGRYTADLGPTWVWPDYQPVVAGWIEQLSLHTFEQYEEGQGIIDQGPGQPGVPAFLPSQTGSRRLLGGPQAMIDHLSSLLPAGTLLTGHQVRHIDATRAGINIEVTIGSDATERAQIEARTLVIAMPPRIAARALSWDPPLPPDVANALARTPTWMAPHAKAVVHFREPFWRTSGLSGRIASRAGPLVETHDHCGPDGTDPALFGFVGWPHDIRAQVGNGLEAAIKTQLERCFGPESPKPVSLSLQDWATDPLVTSPADVTGPMAHPEVAPDVLRAGHAANRVWFAGAETARQGPGLIEGALDAAERTARQILERT